MPNIIHPEGREAWLNLRTHDITSTESAALIGASPYSTEFELYHQKLEGRVVEIEDNERMKWGRRLEDSIARGVAEDMGWTVRKLNAYARHDTERMGASFDFEIVQHKDGPGIMEIKNVDYIQFRDNWLIDGDEIEAPMHIEIQLQHQLEVMDRSWGAIVVLVGGNAPKVIIRQRDPAVGQALVKKVRSFWKRVEERNAPEPTYPQDAKFVASLYNNAEPGKIFDATSDDDIATLVSEYKLAAHTAKEASEYKEVVKAKILQRIGDAEKVIGGHFSISASIVAPAQIAYTREGYRNFRINFKKEKAA